MKIAFTQEYDIGTPGKSRGREVSAPPPDFSTITLYGF